MQQQLSAVPRRQRGRRSKLNHAPLANSRPVAVPGATDLNEGEFSTDIFRMYKLKVSPCFVAYRHDWARCPNYHQRESVRRRNPAAYQYSPVPCPSYRLGRCRKGDSCEFAHGLFETWLHPAIYRTTPCRDGDRCLRKVCFFAHSANELRPIYTQTGHAERQRPSRLPPAAAAATPYGSGHNGFVVPSSYDPSDIERLYRRHRRPGNSGYTVEVSDYPGPAMPPASAGTMSHNLDPESQRYQSHPSNAVALNPNRRTDLELLAGRERSFQPQFGH
uniref:C3H1-type domain-containing protein n=1 Tax=Kalanchoe fedtschenkoi TaxID=63787 RepID=A0A7N0RF83_KALFE